MGRSLQGRHGRVAAVGVVVTSMVLGVPAAAQDASKAAAAQALFDEAVRLMQQGDLASACPKLAASEQLDPGAGTLMNLGNCYEKTGRTASAWATYAEASSIATRSGHADWAARAAERVMALEPKLARLAVVVLPETRTTGLTISRDGVALEAGAWGVPIPVDPGEHTVAAAAGKKGWSATVQVKEEGATETVTVPRLEDEEPIAARPTTPLPQEAPLPSPVEPAGFWSTRRTASAITAGAGVVALGVGAVLGLEAKATYDSATSQECRGGGPRCTPRGVSLGQDAHTLADVSTALFIVGGVALAAGATLFATARSAAPRPAAFRVAPRVGTRDAGILLEGVW